MSTHAYLDAVGSSFRGPTYRVYEEVPGDMRYLGIVYRSLRTGRWHTTRSTEGFKTRAAAVRSLGGE